MKELNNFQIRNIRIMTHLLEHDAASEEVIEIIRENELDYFSLQQKYKLLEKNINIDEKTGLLKCKEDYLSSILKTASRIFHGMKSKEYPIVFIRFDIDDFSIFNNKYGHDLGDIVLKDISHILLDNSRPTDYVIRFGGEEMDVILPATDIEGGKVYIDKIYDTIHKYRTKYNNQEISVTLSSGITVLHYTFDSSQVINEKTTNKLFKKIQKEADDALYEAKYTGKDKYCFYDSKKHNEYCSIREKYAASKNK